MAEVARGDLAPENDGISATSKLFAQIYSELRQLAERRMYAEGTDQTLQATALVHEAFVRLVDQSRPQSWDSPGHLFAAAAQAMRRILVERARRKNRIKNGAGFVRQAMEDVSTPDPDLQLLELDDALSRLTLEDSEAATIVELHHFAGLSHEAVAEALKISVYQARQKWSFARAWLQDALTN